MDLTIYENEQVTRPLAKEIVNLIINKKICYSQAIEALEIAKKELNSTFPHSEG